MDNTFLNLYFTPKYCLEIKLTVIIGLSRWWFHLDIYQVIVKYFTVKADLRQDACYFFKHENPLPVCINRTPSRHGTLNQCWFNVGPASQTMAQQDANIVSTSRACWELPLYKLHTGSMLVWTRDLSTATRAKILTD